jgi:hypothetical protein
MDEVARLLREGRVVDELLYVSSWLCDGDSSGYVVPLRTPIRYVLDAYVLDYHVPRTQTVIDRHNCVLRVHVSDQAPITLRLSTGPCTDVAALIERLRTAATAPAGSISLSWAQSAEGRVCVTADRPFWFQYESLCSVLGFARSGARLDASPAGANAYELCARYAPDLEPARCVQVRSDALGQHVSTVREDHRAVLLGQLDITDGYRRTDFSGLHREGFFPIGKLSSLHISLQNADGTRYETHGRHHTLTIALRRLTARNAVHAIGPSFQSRLAPSYRLAGSTFASDSDDDA